MATPTTLRCEHCLRAVAVRGGCRRHPGAGALDLSDPDDAAYARSVSAVRTDGRGRRWSTLGWSGVAALMGGFVLAADPFSALPPGVEDLGLLGMAVAAGLLALSVGAHGVGAVRGLPRVLAARRQQAVDRRAARADPALRESARDLDRARLLRAGALAAFVVLVVVSSGSIGSVDVGHHDLRGLEGMPTTGLLAALTALGGLVIVATPLVGIGRWMLVRIGRGPEHEAMDATGLVDEAWDLDRLDLDRLEPAPRDPTPTGERARRPPPTPAHAQPHSGWE